MRMAQAIIKFQHCMMDKTKTDKILLLCFVYDRNKSGLSLACKIRIFYSIALMALVIKSILFEFSRGKFHLFAALEVLMTVKL